MVVAHMAISVIRYRIPGLRRRATHPKKLGTTLLQSGIWPRVGEEQFRPNRTTTGTDNAENPDHSRGGRNDFGPDLRFRTLGLGDKKQPPTSTLLLLSSRRQDSPNTEIWDYLASDNIEAAACDVQSLLGFSPDKPQRSKVIARRRSALRTPESRSVPLAEVLSGECARRSRAHLYCLRTAGSRAPRTR